MAIFNARRVAYVCVGCCIMYVASGCASTKPAGHAELQHQSDVTRAEITLEQLTERLDRYNDAIESAVRGLEDVRERAATLDSTVDRLTELFEQYDNAVRDTIQRLRAVQSESTQYDQIGSYTYMYTTVTVGIHGNWIYFIRKRYKVTTLVRYTTIIGISIFHDYLLRIFL